MNKQITELTKQLDEERAKTAALQAQIDEEKFVNDLMVLFGDAIKNPNSTIVQSALNHLKDQLAEAKGLLGLVNKYGVGSYWKWEAKVQEFFTKPAQAKPKPEPVEDPRIAFFVSLLTRVLECGTFSPYDHTGVISQSRLALAEYYRSLKS